MIEKKEDNSSFVEKGLSFIVPFLGLALFLKKKNRWINGIGFLVNLTICAILFYLLIRYVPFPTTRFSYFGKKPLCNLKEERAIHFGSFVFVLCYRCTFIILGSIIAFLCLYLRKIRLHWVCVVGSIILILPCFFDGIFQLLTSYESTNALRSITGFGAGIGIGYILYMPFKKWNLFF